MVQRVKWFSSQGYSVAVMSYSVFMQEGFREIESHEVKSLEQILAEPRNRIQRMSTRPVMVMTCSSECEDFLSKQALTKKAYRAKHWIDYKPKDIPVPRINPVSVLMDGQSCTSMFTNIFISLTQEFLSVRENGHSFEVDEMYHLERLITRAKRNYTTAYGPRPVVSKWGDWTRTHGLSATSIPFHVRRWDMKGVQMRVSVTHDPPYVVVQEIEDEKIMSGYMIDLWRALETRLNITTKYKFVPAGGTTAMHYQVVDGYDDVALLNVVPSNAEEMRHSYSKPLYYSRFEIKMALNNIPDYSSYLYLQPFSPLMWMSFVLTWLLLSACIAMVYAIGKRYMDIDSQESGAHTLPKTIEAVMGTFLQQGHNDTSSLHSGRLLYLVTYLVAIILLSAYGSDLISILSQQERTLPIDNLEDLLADGSYEFYPSVKLGLLFKDDNSTFGVVMNKFRGTDPVLSVHRLCSERRAMQFDSEEWRYYAHQIPCPLATFKKNTISVPRTFIVTPGSMYKPFIDMGVTKLITSGIMQKMLLDGFDHEQEAPETVDVPEIVLEVVRPLLLLGGAGMSVAVLLLLLECAAHYCVRRVLRK